MYLTYQNQLEPLSYLERHFSRLIIGLCFTKYQNGLRGLIQNLVNGPQTNTPKKTYFSRLKTLLASNSDLANVVRFSELIGLNYHNYYLTPRFQETLKLENNHYSYSIQFLDGINQRDTFLINNHLLYCYLVINTIAQVNKTAAKVSYFKKSISLCLDVSQLKFNYQLPVYWLTKYSTEDCHSSIQSNITAPFGCHPLELINSPIQDYNITEKQLDKIAIYPRWSEWSRNLLWQRKRHLILPLTLVSQRRANIISLYDEWDHLTYYTELGELLLALSQVDLGLQQLVSCYL